MVILYWFGAERTCDAQDVGPRFVSKKITRLRRASLFEGGVALWHSYSPKRLTAIDWLCRSHRLQALTDCKAAFSLIVDLLHHSLSRM